MWHANQQARNVVGWQSFTLITYQFACLRQTNNGHITDHKTIKLPTRETIKGWNPIVPLTPTQSKIHFHVQCTVAKPHLFDARLLTASAKPRFDGFTLSTALVFSICQLKYSRLANIQSKYFLHFNFNIHINNLY